jgi:hypothetical protein
MLKVLCKLVFGSAVYGLWKARNAIRFCGGLVLRSRFLIGSFGKLNLEFLGKVFQED